MVTRKYSFCKRETEESPKRETGQKDVKLIPYVYTLKKKTKNNKSNKQKESRGTQTTEYRQLLKLL